jgi:hypothetical protein
VDVGEITAAAAGNENLLAGTIGVLNYGDVAPAFAGLHRAQESRGPGAKNQRIKLVVQGSFQPRLGIYDRRRSQRRVD